LANDQHFGPFVPAVADRGIQASIKGPAKLMLGE
jgi:hypothetical protein